MRRVALLLACTVAATASCSALGFAGACEGTEVIGRFEQIGQLVPASNVQSSDVVVGSVQDVELDGWIAEVTMCLDAEEHIPADVEAVVRTTSLLGEKFVDLRPVSDGPPFLEDGAILDVDHTGKATELEEVFAKLASILGTGNLEQVNRLVRSQAEILGDNSGKLRKLLIGLRDFTDVLAERKDQIATSIDGLDAAARTVLGEREVLDRFLRSFADSSEVLADQRDGLRSLLLALDRFSNITVQLLNQTESGLDRQLRDLRPILATAVANSGNLRATLRTLATFVEWFPETMPGDYVQLDVCQAAPEYFGQGRTCPQSLRNDDPRARSTETGAPAPDTGSVEFLLKLPLRETDR